ncbi:MAG TPA: ATP synthase F0 subunit C [Thermotogota bacterium]|jgi:F-type H+-transporting ATPase subunit c|nr:ATP synthase F0 subunit C [Thermotogota bacterium]NLH19294.1 ATP synthase F0 subunit C [Thermotogaceae bacterium]OQC32443.1 MAG: ATP synthase subunit c, sodium ion specific [Thermotogota bacterium ADurb.Bin062]HNW45782.1 ATP synthase F0 subunit C [Thermotogota bacterium]HNY81305.1 ATP synthase F0 subunit C [Thermotogota bacterium]
MEMSAAIVQAAKYLGAGICMGLAAIGPAIGEGNIGAHAMDAMARQPEMAGNLRISMIIADAIAETTGLYGLLISFMILFA